MLDLLNTIIEKTVSTVKSAVATAWNFITSTYAKVSNWVSEKKEEGTVGWLKIGAAVVATIAAIVLIKVAFFTSAAAAATVGFVEVATLTTAQQIALVVFGLSALQCLFTGNVVGFVVNGFAAYFSILCATTALVLLALTVVIQVLMIIYILVIAKRVSDVASEAAGDAAGNTTKKFMFS